MNQERSKSYYEILALDPFCSPDDIKQAFRQQVALSHPDKVSHLAREIQELAFQRTTELTEAYRILSNGELRSDYDRRLQYNAKLMVPTNGSTKASKNEDLSGGLKKDDFLFKTGLGRMKSAVQEALPGMEEAQVNGFDAAFAPRRKWNILSARGCAQVLVRSLPLIDSPAIEDAWNRALKAVRSVKGDVYLFLMGLKLDGADKISGSILALQRRARLQDETKILVIPLNVNSFAALIPNGAPDSLRAIIRALQ
jgi:curved DNA-binding protein CbpA